MTTQPHPVAPNLINNLFLLYRARPAIRIVVGAVLLISGAAALGLFYWKAGGLMFAALAPIIASCALLFLAVNGLFLLLSGLSAQRRERLRKQEWSEIEKKKDEWVAQMIEVKKQGKSPLRFLTEKGIEDVEFRGHLMKAMEERLKQNA